MRARELKTEPALPEQISGQLYLPILNDPYKCLKAAGGSHHAARKHLRSLEAATSSFCGVWPLHRSVQEISSLLIIFCDKKMHSLNCVNTTALSRPSSWPNSGAVYAGARRDFARTGLGYCGKLPFHNRLLLPRLFGPCR